MNGLNSVKALNFLDTHFSKKGFYAVVGRNYAAS